jgi:hypothetical protein
MNALVRPNPLAAWTDFSPPGPWSDGTVVTRNIDGVGFTYSLSLNALLINPNLSASVKNANSFIIQNLPAPSVGGDAANKTYVDAHAGSGGGIADAPSDSTYYGRYNATWVHVLSLAGGTLTGPLILNVDPAAPLGAATKQYADTKAPLASPVFTGTPLAPTPLTTDNTTTIATTAFVKAQGYLVTNQSITLSGDISGTGTSAITTLLATVNSNVGTFQGITVNGKGLVTGAVNMSYAPLASPIFTGNPTAPTPATADSSTSLATTAFVKNQGYSTSGGGGSAVYISDTAPVGAPVNSLWWESDSGVLYVYYNDGDSTQWVQAAASPVDSTYFMPKTGGTMTGSLTVTGDITAYRVAQPTTGVLYLGNNPSTVYLYYDGTNYNLAGGALNLPGNPTSALQAAPKQYVDAQIGLTFNPNAGRLNAVSASSLQFVPFNGNYIKINGILYSIPSGGITASNTGVYINGVVGNLAVSTTYYVYVFNNAGTPTIDFSTTAKATSSTAGNVGVWIKSGDDTRSLVGMIRTNASAQFDDSTNIRHVLSWFNQQDKYSQIGIGNFATSSTTAVQLGTATIEMLNWANQAISMWIGGQGQTTGSYSSIGTWLDGATIVGIQQIMYTLATNYIPVNTGGWYTPAEGNHIYAGYFGAISGSGTFSMNNCSLNGMTKG